jgi:hypothetical protein
LIFVIKRIETKNEWERERKNKWINYYLILIIFSSFVVLIFVVFVLSPRVALRCWLLLVFYTAAIISLIYFWNFSWTLPFDENHIVKLIGI